MVETTANNETDLSEMTLFDNNVSVNVLWRLSARRGARRRLWLPGGRHQAGNPPIGSAGQASSLSAARCCRFGRSDVVKLSSRRAVGAR